jgi:hypothetical protein
LIDGAAGAHFHGAHRRYRTLLWRRWSDDPLWLWVLLNPSTADGQTLDPTMRRVKGFTERLGGGGFVVANLFSWRATHPRDLNGKTLGRLRGSQNDAAIEHALTVCDRVMVAWGSLSQRRWARHEAERLIGRLRAGSRTLHALGEPTADGQPRHPLYLRGDARLRVT